MAGRRKIKQELLWLNNFAFFPLRERRKGNKIVMSDPNKLRLFKSVSVIQTNVHIFANIQPLSVCDVFQETALPWAKTLASVFQNNPRVLTKGKNFLALKITLAGTLQRRTKLARNIGEVTHGTITNIRHSNTTIFSDKNFATH